MSGNVSVLTYENPYTFAQKPEFQPYVNCPQICATQSLKFGVKKGIGLKNVTSAGEIVDLFYPNWNLAENRFIQYAQLSDILRNWNEARHPKVIRSFKRNKLNLLITMRNFTEMGLKPHDLRPHKTKVEEELFCDLWDKLLPYFADDMARAKGKIMTLEQVRAVFQKAEVPLVNDTVVLHGFYYISPVQHFLFTRWKELGIKLVFLNLYHHDYPAVFSFLEENFSETYGWARKEDWTMMRDEEAFNVNGLHFASRFQGSRGKHLNQEAIKEKPYEYMVEFVDDLKEDVHYVSPNRDELKERIREFRPNSFLKERHFLAYPIGQYLFHLHSVWNEEEQNYILTDKILMESFASGWLESEGENARDYTAHLKSVLPYFSNCRTADEWLNQFETLMDAKRSSIQAFKKYSLKRNDFMEAVRVSPVLRFSYFSVPMRALKKMQFFLRKLVVNAKWLVDIKEERIQIKTHFQRIQQLLEDSNLKSSLANEMERKLVNQLEELLTQPIHDEQRYHVGDLSDAIIVFLRTGLEDPDQNEMGSLDFPPSDPEEEGQVEAENGRSKQLHLYKMADLDGLILRDDLKELHLCGMDEQHFPETATPMPWPLSFELITNLNHRSADMYVFRKRHSLAFSRYLFYVALCSKQQIRLSWVKNWNEYENLDPSIYIQVLDLVRDNEGSSGQYEYIEPTATPSDVEISAIQKRLGALPQEEFAEMSICKKRFSYSTLVDGFSSFRSHFHQGFLIGNLVKIYASIGKTKTEIIEMLETMFPYQTEISLRTIVDQNMNEDYVAGMRKYGLAKRRKFNDIDYPESMLYFQFLTHRGAFQNERWQSAFSPPSGIRRQKAELIQQMAHQKGALAEATPSEFCKLCPHEAYCEEAYYAVDISKKGFDDHDAAGV